MNAERLHAIVVALKKELDGNRVLERLQNLVNALNNLAQSSNTGTQQQLSSHLESMRQAVSNSETDAFSPAWKQVLAELGGDGLVGSSLRRTIDKIIERNQMTPAVAATELDTVRQQLEQFATAVTLASQALRTFKIGSEDLKPGECEIGVMIPRAAVDDSLPQFAKELDKFKFIFQTFSEVATGSTDKLEIKNISSSALTIYLAAAAKYAEVVSKAVSGVVKAYEAVLGIRKLISEMKKLSLPPEQIKTTEDHAQKLIQDQIEQLSVEIVHEYKGKKDGREHEVKTHVKFALTEIARRIDQGYQIEVRCKPLSGQAAEDRAEEQAALLTVQRLSKETQFLKLDGEPILALPPAQEPEPTATKSPVGSRKFKKTEDS